MLQAGGDEKCNQAASAAGLYGVFKAWLSDDRTSASERMVHYSQRHYVTTYDTTIFEDYPYRIALNWDDLTDGTIETPVMRDEFGLNVDHARVWTGTNDDGSGRGDLHGASDCSGWMDDSGLQTGLVGNSDFLDSRWTEADYLSCNHEMQLICVQQ